MSTPVEAPSFLPDKKSFIYVDRKGGEDQWRKHHTSSVTREIWMRIYRRKHREQM